MNRNELVAQSQLNIKTLNEILDGLSIPKNLEDYTDEHLKLVQAIQEIRKDEKVQSWPEAIAIYRRPINEHQLNEIALRHAINAEQIPEILKALKLKVETLTEPQFEAFREVCLAVQSGIDLNLAAQASLNKVKGSKAKAAPKAETAIAKTDGGAIAETSEASESESEAIALLGAIPNQQSLRDKARQEATLDRSGFTTDAVEEIFNTSDHLRGLGKNYGRQLYVEEFQAAMNDPEAIEESQRIIDEISRRRRPNRKP